MATNDTAENTGAHRANASSAPDASEASADGAAPEVAELQADIERTRADLADAVDRLTAKLDVKTRVSHSVADTKDAAAARLRHLQDQATDDDGRPTSTTLGIGGGTLAAVLALLVIALWRRNHTTRPPRSRR